MKIKNTLYIPGLLLFLFLAGCVTHTPYPTTEYVLEEVSLKEICDANDIDWHWDTVSQVITLTSQTATAKALVGSSIVLVNDEKVYLDSPILNKRSRVVVSSDFSEKVITKLSSSYISTQNIVKEKKEESHNYPPILKVQKVREIVIDAGHGGKDPGALGHSGTQEKDIVLDISRKLRQILKKRGYKVRMTRKRDEFITLERRTNIVSKSNADLFVSIHANASPSKSVHGFEVFASKDLHYQDKNHAVRQANLNHIMKSYRMKRNDPDLESIVEDMLYTHKQAESKELARKMAEASAKTLRVKNRGDKDSRFFVLRNTFVPAILVEVGFLSNPKEERLLKSAKYRNLVAESIADSIQQYVKSQ